eukprot:SAG11_NODE_916_length_6555_cov_5.026332_1_plen_101_part_00
MTSGWSASAPPISPAFAAVRLGCSSEHTRALCPVCRDAQLCHLVSLHQATMSRMLVNRLRPTNSSDFHQEHAAVSKFTILVLSVCISATGQYVTSLATGV